MPNKVLDEITYPFPNINGCTVEVWKMDKLFHHAIYNECNYLFMLELELIPVSKRGPWNEPAPASEAVIFKALFHTFDVYSGMF